MRINWINTIIATLIAAICTWGLWIWGIDDLQKILLAALGGAIVEIGLILGMGVTYDNPRSGSQARMIFIFMVCTTLIASFIYSFFNFSAAGYCIPIGIFCLILFFSAFKIIQTKE